MKALSNALFLAAVALLVIAVVTGSLLLYVAAGFVLVDSFAVTVLKRRMFRSRKAALHEAPPQP